MDENLNQLNIDEIKDTIQDCNINFLIGAGMSAPYLKSLGPIEELLTDLEKQDINDDEKKVIRASLYKKFFDDVILKNLDILTGSEESKKVLGNYGDFLRSINRILLNRKNTIHTKQINIFTTNVDIFLDKALETMGLEYNDGFSGRFSPKFNLNNLKKSYFKTSLHYDNTSEIPVFNLLKIHGSLTWLEENNDGNIFFSDNLFLVEEIKKEKIEDTYLIQIPDGCIKSDCEQENCNDQDHKIKIQDLSKTAKGKKSNEQMDSFMKSYEKLSIINPTKEKFKTTLLNKTYYDQLRIYANELEKENTVLFVMGFSFADEHIRDMTIKVAESNPTLVIYVFLRNSDTKIAINFDKLKNGNIKIIFPPKQIDVETNLAKDVYEQNLATINKYVFEKILKPDEEKVHKVTIVNTPDL